MKKTPSPWLTRKNSVMDKDFVPAGTARAFRSIALDLREHSFPKLCANYTNQRLFPFHPQYLASSYFTKMRPAGIPSSLFKILVTSSVIF